MWYNLTSIDNVVDKAEISSKYVANAHETRPGRASTLARVGISTLITIMPVIYGGCRDGSSTKPTQPVPTTDVSQDREEEQPPKPQQAFYKHLEGNKLLNQKEKALAKRIYDFAHSDVAKEKIEEDINFDPAIFDLDLYDKWGLNRKEGLSLEDQAYASVIGFMEATIKVGYEMEQAIRNHTLSEKQKKFLRETHERFGEGPVSLDQIPGDGHEESKYVHSFFEALFGHKKLTDQDFLVLNKLFGGLEVVPYVLYKAY